MALLGIATSSKSTQQSASPLPTSLSPVWGGAPEAGAQPSVAWPWRGSIGYSSLRCVPASGVFNVTLILTAAQASVCRARVPMQALGHGAFLALSAGGHEFISGERQEAAQSTQLINRQRMQLEVLLP